MDRTVSWRLALPRGRILELDGRPRVMAVLNVTPDSFSDGGLWLDPARAAARGLEMIDQGADIVDVGAESTRPGGGVYGAGADEVAAGEELGRLIPVLKELRAATDAVLSVDTRKAAVARRALAEGADLVNDVSGLAEAELAAVVAEAACPLVVMHSRGEFRTMQRGIRFGDVTAEVAAELAELVARAMRAGVDEDRVIVDPGIGFGKTARQNLRLLAELGRLHALGRPILVGASRKSFIAEVSPAPPGRRLGGSLAAVAAAVRGKAAIVRVHDVAETVQYLRLRNAIDSATATPD